MTRDTDATGTDDGSVDIDVDDRVSHGYDSEGQELSDEDVQRLEDERRERLDPENRPANAEVDNTDRDFDAEKGVFNVPAEEAANGPEIGADRPEGVEVDDE